MNQLFTHYFIFTSLSLIFLSCGSENVCREITGRWTNREGQVLSFDGQGNGLWLVKFGSQYDSFPIQYRYTCGRKSTTLDLTNITSGPLAGKTLFGIIEWSNDSVFRFDAESGTGPEARPQKIVAERSGKFYRD